MADRTRSCASTRKRTPCRAGRCLRTRRTRISTRSPSTGKGASGLPGRAGTTDGSIPRAHDMRVWNAPRGSGPYGITTTPSGDVYYASLAGSHIARIDVESGAATVIEPPHQGPGRAPCLVRFARPRLGELLEHGAGRHVRSGRASRGANGSCPATRMPTRSGSTIRTRSGSPTGRPTRSSASIPRPRSSRASSPIARAADVRQMLGRAGEAWGAESGNDRLVMIPAR